MVRNKQLAVISRNFSGDILGAIMRMPRQEFRQGFGDVWPVCDGERGHDKSSVFGVLPQFSQHGLEPGVGGAENLSSEILLIHTLVIVELRGRHPMLAPKVAHIPSRGEGLGYQKQVVRQPAGMLEHAMSIGLGAGEDRCETRSPIIHSRFGDL